MCCLLPSSRKQTCPTSATFYRGRVKRLSEFEVLLKGVGHLASMTECRCHMSPVGRTIGWCGCTLLQHLAMYLGLKHFRIKFRIFLASHHHLSKSIASLLLMQSACKSCSNLGSPLRMSSWPAEPLTCQLVNVLKLKSTNTYKHYVHLIWFSNMFDVNHPGVLAVIAIVWAASVHPFPAVRKFFCLVLYEQVYCCLHPQV